MIQQSKIIVSFDLELLFTNILIDTALQACLVETGEWSKPPNCTTQVPSQIMDLLNFVWRSTHFHENGSTVKRQKGQQ